MIIRKSTLSDVDAIMEIYDGARSYMLSEGNPHQWGGGYPYREIVIEDIENGHSYICEDEGLPVAVFCYFKGVDESYNEIYSGCWLDDGPYAVIHRIAVSVHGKGIASFCIRWCISQSDSIRIDTHEDNHPMQNLLNKLGFSYCGKIKCSYTATERLAFQFLCVESTAPVCTRGEL